MGIKKRGSSLFILLPFVLIILLNPEVCKATNEANLCITQINSQLPDVTLYVRLENVNMNSAKLKKNLSISINDTPARITDINSLRTKNEVTENTAYLVLVDTSISMQNQFSELRILLERLLGLGALNEKTAFFAVSNKLDTIKDFGGTDSIESLTNNISSAISSSSGKGTYLYSGICDAINKGGMAEDIPTRRIIVLITAGSVKGDYLSSDDLNKYVEVDRLPVYTLILNHQDSVTEEFKNSAEKIAQKTGGQSFMSASGDELFSRFQTSIEKCSVIKLRCDNFKEYNLQAVMNVALKVNNGEIRQAAKFTAIPAPIDKDQANQASNTKELRTSYFGVAAILIPMLLFLGILLTLLWFFINKGIQQDITKGDLGREENKGE